MIIKRGGKLNVQDHKKNTPLMVAAFFNKPNIMKFLIDAGAELLVRNNEEKDAFDVANDKDHVEARSVIGRELERIGVFRKNVSNRIDHDLAMSFENKAKIK